LPLRGLSAPLNPRYPYLAKPNGTPIRSANTGFWFREPKLDLCLKKSTHPRGFPNSSYHHCMGVMGQIQSPSFGLVRMLINAMHLWHATNLWFVSILGWNPFTPTPMSRYFGVVGKGFFEPLPQPFNTRGGGHPSPQCPQGRILSRLYYGCVWVI